MINCTPLNNNLLYYDLVHARKGEVEGEYGRILEGNEGNSDYGGMVQPSQQHVAPCVKGVEWRLVRSDL